MAFPRRKKQFIASSVQGALTRRILYHWLTFMLVTCLVSFILQVLANPFEPLAAHFENLWWAQGPFLLVMVFLLPVFVFDTIKISHRFAGPIFSLRRAIREVADGQPARRLQFRRRDFWRELADDYNTMLARLGAVDDQKTSAEKMEELIASK
jgi:hypothetical protein